MCYLDVDSESRVWLADNCESMPPELQETLPEVHVWLAHIYQAYGGPEEGGWWFLVHNPTALETATQMRLDQARAHVRAENQKIVDNLPDNHPPISSTISQGEHRWVWTFDPPCTYPKTKPRYE